MAVRILKTVGLIGLFVYLFYLIGLNLFFKRWGTTDREWNAVYPGDSLLQSLTYSNIRAITIRAPASAIMPWLKQLGIRKAGLYSYDGLENLLGLNVHSADRILPRYQHIRLGDTLLLGPMGGPRLVAIQENRHLLFYTGANQEFQNSWLFYLVPQPDGSTRLLTVYRMYYPPTVANFVIWRMVTEPAHFIMEWKMLRGIRDRAEKNHRTRS
ncbi:hypothetical protein GCM10028803_08660 [Larkinella knui]|uniref:SRPBCC family protein n=1 Tax=Larkinella knui TaxID=2025310 RepID=A0A3P1CKN9_9BACT|nr:hypothetical protein [Larkinella knui]RRB13474.1 hypothetical protein EHT87_14470 [Larkinella knui]